MKRQFIKWTFRLIVTVVFLFGLLIVFMFNPNILYANKTTIGNYSIYHNKPIDPSFYKELTQSQKIILSSELYDPTIKIDVCLKDGAKYPRLIETVLGKDFISSFYNKIIFTADDVNYKDNYLEAWGHRWNLTTMMAHAQMHCLEFHKYGFFKSNPVARYPAWKWEGYPEYIARQSFGKQNLVTNIEKYIQTKDKTNGWVKWTDNSETFIQNFKYQLLVQYCMEVKKMSFENILTDSENEESITTQMLKWYNEQRV